MLDKLLLERNETEGTDETDQVELVDFDPDQERQHHHNGEANEEVKHHPSVSASPSKGAGEQYSLLAFSAAVNA